MKTINEIHKCDHTNFCPSVLTYALPSGTFMPRFEHNMKIRQMHFGAEGTKSKTKRYLKQNLTHLKCIKL